MTHGNGETRLRRHKTGTYHATSRRMPGQPVVKNRSPRPSRPQNRDALMPSSGARHSATPVGQRASAQTWSWQLHVKMARQPVSDVGWGARLPRRSGLSPTTPGGVQCPVVVEHMRDRGREPPRRSNVRGIYDPFRSTGLPSPSLHVSFTDYCLSHWLRSYSPAPT